MRSLVLPFLLLSTLALAKQGPASCEISHPSVVSKTASGMARVGNLELIQIRCQVGARPLPSIPGTGRNGLRAGASVFIVSADGTRKAVPSEVNATGGGSSGGMEWVDFYLHIPLDTAERALEIRKYIAYLEGAAHDEDSREIIRAFRKNPEALAPIVDQNRVGRFQVGCRVLDGESVIGVGSVGLEVLFTGHFSDALMKNK